MPRMKKVLYALLVFMVASCATQRSKISRKELALTPEHKMLIIKAAEYGVPVSQYQAGIFYLNGDSVEKNEAIAKEWFEKSASQGYALAQTMLGAMYSSGQGAPLDYGMAKIWYEKAVAQNEPVAENNLGVMYLNGLGVTKECSLAIKYLEASAKHGYLVGADSLRQAKSVCK